MAEELFNNAIEEQCIHGQDAPCSCACPFPLNVRDFVEKVRKGSFNAAFHLYREAVGFPELVWQICPAPCGQACQRALGQKINLPMLEQAAIAYARSTEPVNYNLPKKQAGIAVVGAGLAGLSCARRLSSLNYDVTVYEQQEVLCASLEKLLPRENFEPAIRKQFQFTDCKILTGHRVENVEELSFDAVYISGGDLPLPKEDWVFHGPPGLSLVEELAEGVRAADDIEWFLKTGKRKPLQEDPGTEKGGEENTGSVTELPSAAQERKGQAYSKGEARQEADRCTRCDCSACMRECVLLRQYGQTPRDLSKDVGLALNVFPETQGRAGMREIGACNFCGLCKKVCPSGIDMGAFLLKSRTELCRRGLLPKAHHDFWMRDMEFSDGEQAALWIPPESLSGEPSAPTFPAAPFLFFPGCQAGGSDFRYVTMTYERLREQYPGSGLLLRCCGAPALWAGEETVFREKHEKLRAYWREAGEPVMLLSCPSCYRIFRDYLPEIPVKMLYEVLSTSPQNREAGWEAVVFDPCSSREYPQIQETVREMAKESGAVLSEELKYSRELAQCCSFGGHGYTVNPLVVRTQAKEQASQSDLPYLTYCTNCRDILSAQGKECRHILDLVNCINEGFRRPPTVTERRNNRRRLKRELMRKYFPKESFTEEEEMLTLRMEDSVAQRMSEDLILEEDLARAIESCEREKNFVIFQENGHRACHLKIGYLTYWVEYMPEEAGSCRVYTAYSHRMVIKGEA